MILQINKMYAPDIGGIETVVGDYSNYLKKYDTVVILCVNRNFSFKTKKELIDGVMVYRCASLGTFMSMPLSFSFYYYMYRLSRKANIVHIHEPFPLASIAWFLIPQTVRLFVTWHSNIVKQKRVKKFFEFFQKKLLQRSNRIITTSKEMITYSTVLSTYKEKTIIIPIGITSNDYLRNNISTTILNHLPSDYVLFIGRLAYYKGIFTLLDAIELIKIEIPFVIVGDGPLAPQIKKIIDNSKKEIYFINRFVTDEEKKCLLKHSKFMVFPSNYPSEAFGITQLESMVYGRPVINTSLPTGVPWVSKHNVSGLTVSVNNYYELATAIEKLYQNKILYKKLSKGSLKRIKNEFDMDKIHKQIHKLYFQ